MGKKSKKENHPRCMDGVLKGKKKYLGCPIHDFVYKGQRRRKGREGRPICVTYLPDPP